MSDLTVLNVVAYLDPGTGSLLVQFLLGAIVGSGVWFRKHVIATVARIFRFGRKSSEASREASAEPLSAAPVDQPAEAAATATDASSKREEAREEESVTQ